jgi:hypothetical protein
MSTRVGVLAEGPMDHALIAPLIRQIARKRAQFTWPVDPSDAADWLKLRPRGHGGVWLALQRVVRVLREEESPYAFIIILLDRRTKAIQGRFAGSFQEKTGLFWPLPRKKSRRGGWVTGPVLYPGWASMLHPAILVMRSPGTKQKETRNQRRL